MWKIIIMNLLKHIYIVALHLQYIMLKIYAKVSNQIRTGADPESDLYQQIELSR